MSFKAWRRVPEAGACDFCLMLATRGAVYKSDRTAGASKRYHRHCSCHAELETDFDAREDVRISPEDANREIVFRNNGRTYGYDMSSYRNLGVTDPPKVPKLEPVNVSLTPELDKLTRIDPETAEVAVTKTNPKYAEKFEYRNNCTRCVTSLEMRRRGYDVAAAPSMADSPHKVIRQTFSADSIKARERLVQKPKGGKHSAIGSGDPDGSRYYVWGQWKTGGGWHIWSAEMRDGAIHFFEPQTGKSLGVKGYTGRAKKVSYCRVDDLDLIDGVVDLVVPST